MVDEETIDTEFTEKEETVEDEINEEKSKFDERKDETKEKIKNIADNVINDLYKSIDEFRESIKNMQKSADQK